MATVKFNIGNDPVTGKKMKYTNVEVRFQYGEPIEFIGSISLHEVNDDPALPAGTDSRSKKAVESYMENFQTRGLFIDSVSKLYVAGLTDGNGDPIPNAIALGLYLEQKAINTFPGVAGADPLWQGIEGVCKEMVAIRQANGELPV